MTRALSRCTIAALSVLVAGGCSLTPTGTSEERDRLQAAGKPYEQPFEKRELPELPAQPAWQDLLHRAFMADGNLEAAYFEWNAACERITIASAWPNSRVMLGYSYALGPSDMKTFDRMTFSGTFDGAMNLSFPSKTAAEGRIALAEARAAGERFRAAKFDLQQRVLSVYADYCMISAQERARSEQAAIAGSAAATSAVRIGPGSGQDDVLKARAASEDATNALRTTRAELASARAALNAMLARNADTPISVPPAFEPRPLTIDDNTFLLAAVEQNPELAALARSVDGRADALERAKLEWLPDINPSISITGDAAQAIGASIMLPTTISKIRAQTREAEAMLKASAARLRQSRREKASLFIGTLLMMRDAEAQALAVEARLLPLAEQLLASSRRRYEAGAGPYTDFLDAQRTLLDTRLLAIQARAQREKRLAELESLMGADIETLVSPSSVGPMQEPTHAR